MQSVLLTISLQVSAEGGGKARRSPVPTSEPALAVLGSSSLEGCRQSPTWLSLGHFDLESQWMAGKTQVPLAAAVGLRNGREMELGAFRSVLEDVLGALKQLVRGGFIHLTASHGRRFFCARRS